MFNTLAFVLLTTTLTLLPQTSSAASVAGRASRRQANGFGNIWQPSVGASWQIVLQNSISIDSDATATTPDVDIFDIDLFTTDTSTIDTLHRLGKKVICYFSAGSYEPNRPDSKQFNSKDLGLELKGWPGEKWLNLNSENVRDIMHNRIQLAKDKKCDAIDPDNVDAYDNKNGLKLTSTDSINFINWLSANATALGLSVGLKNAAAILPKVLPNIQFVVNEQCVQFSECTRYAPAITAGKPVFHIEYPSEVKPEVAAQFCSETGMADGAHGFSTAIKNMGLDGWIKNCSGVESSTPTQ